MSFWTPVADLVANSSHSLDWLPGRVGEVPVLVALAWEDRAGVPATYGDYDVGVLDGFGGQDLRGLGGDVDADFAHCLDGHRVNLLGGHGPG